MIHNASSHFSWKISVSEQAHEPLDRETSSQADSISIVVFNHYPHDFDDLRMGLRKNFAQQLHKSDDTIHSRVVIARQQLLSDLFQDKEGLLFTEAFFNQK